MTKVTGSIPITSANFFLAIIRDCPDAYHVYVVALTHLAG
jgi:hypothetical protein